MNVFALSSPQMNSKSNHNASLAFADELPEELLGECANFVIGSLAELSIFCSVSQSFLKSARAVSSDKDAPIWEVILQKADPILYAGVKQLNTCILEVITPSTNKS